MPISSSIVQGDALLKALGLPDEWRKYVTSASLEIFVGEPVKLVVTSVVPEDKMGDMIEKVVEFDLHYHE